MKTAPIAAACCLFLALVISGCSETSSPPGSELAFDCLEIDGVTTDHASTGGVSWVDFDGDGDLDLFVTNGYDVSSPQPVSQPNRLYRNEGGGAFSRVTEGPLANSAGFSSGHTWGDYDNDGDLDVFITNQQDQNNLMFRNEGGEKFVQIKDVPMVQDGGHSYTAAWVDVDRDGLLDLFVANGGMSHAGANRLYRGIGDGNFARITAGEIDTEVASTCGIAWGDYDNDGDADLFVANQGFSPPANHNALYRNDGNWKFTRITDTPVTTDGAPSCTATWVDVDNDLDLDLHVANMYGMANFLYLNDGQGGLTPAEVSPLTLDGGHTYGTNWEDYDNDGDLDAVVANWGAGSGLYLNDGAGKFVRMSGGCLGIRLEYVGAIASGDFDGDGRLDVYIGSWPNNPGPGEMNPLFRNQGGENHWLRLRLVGESGSPGGIGARVTVTTSSGTQMREVTTQTGFRGQSDLAPHFGLGTHETADRVEVRWPSGRTTVQENVAADQVVEIRDEAITP